MRFTAARAPRVDRDGSLVIDTEIGPIRQRPPVAYQMLDGKRTGVQSRYAIGGDGSVGFALGTYDRGAMLTIDPALVYGTYLGGSGADEVKAIAVDATGAAYVAGTTESANFPTKGAYSATLRGYRNVFVTKIDPTGTSMVYSTYIGGTSGDEAYGIAVDAAGAGVH